MKSYSRLYTEWFRPKNDRVLFLFSINRTMLTAMSFRCSVCLKHPLKGLILNTLGKFISWKLNGSLGTFNKSFREVNACTAIHYYQPIKEWLLLIYIFLILTILNTPLSGISIICQLISKFISSSNRLLRSKTTFSQCSSSRVSTATAFRNFLI